VSQYSKYPKPVIPTPVLVSPIANQPATCKPPHRLGRRVIPEIATRLVADHESGVPSTHLPRSTPSLSSTRQIPSVTSGLLLAVRLSYPFPTLLILEFKGVGMTDQNSDFGIRTPRRLSARLAAVPIVKQFLIETRCDPLAPWFLEDVPRGQGRPFKRFQADFKLVGRSLQASAVDGERWYSWRRRLRNRHLEFQHHFI
jgi:hypothetical protein